MSEEPHVVHTISLFDEEMVESLRRASEKIDAAAHKLLKPEAYEALKAAEQEDVRRFLEGRDGVA
jgi:hypothetical protein